MYWLHSPGQDIQAALFDRIVAVNRLPADACAPLADMLIHGCLQYAKLTKIPSDRVAPLFQIIQSSMSIAIKPSFELATYLIDSSLSQDSFGDTVDILTAFVTCSASGSISASSQAIVSEESSPRKKQDKRVNKTYCISRIFQNLSEFH
jgi:hypothetical protein